MNRALRDALVQRPWACDAAAKLAALAGQRDAAAKLRQLGSELVTVEIPAAAVGRGGLAVKLAGNVGRDQVAAALHAGGWDGFEAPMPTVFAACAAAYPGVVYDIGANTGLYTAIAARANKYNTVVAFEPFPPVRDLLESTLRINGLRSRVLVENFAIGDRLGEATLHVPTPVPDVVETSASLRPDFKSEVQDLLPVQVLTLDFFEQERHPGRTTLIKIDVESLEADVLRGAMRILKTHRPLVFCEVLPSGDAGAIERIRRQIRYIDVRLHPTQAEIGRDVSFDPEGWNHLLVPKEKIEAVIELLDRCGLATAWADEIDAASAAT